MCRLTAYLGHATNLADLVTRPSRSVIRQSFDARERLGGSGGEVYDCGNLNADGFGLGWYTKETEDDVTPCVFTDVGPAWNNKNLFLPAPFPAHPVCVVRAETPIVRQGSSSALLLSRGSMRPCPTRP